MYPLLSVYEAAQEEARSRGEDLDVLYVGHERGVEATLARRAGLPFAGVAGGQVRGQAPWQLARNLAHIGRGYGQALRLVRAFRPDVCLITGGWVTVPVALAVRTLGVPMLIYLPDVTPGLAIRTLRHLAARVAVTVPEAAAPFGARAVVTGYPVRRAVLTADRETARRRLGLPLDERVLLVFGGSWGARSINRALVAGLEDLLPLAHVVHITGHLDIEWVQAARAALAPAWQARYHVFAYLHDEMPLALAAADLVVSRAGASVLGEFPARGLPAVLVPYPHAGRHQEHNARYLVAQGAAVMVADEDLGQRLVPVVRALLEDEGRRRRMAAAARAAYRAGGAAAIARELWRLAGA